MLFENQTIKLSDNPRKNLLEYKGKYYQIDFLIKDKYVHGGNGQVFKLVNEEEDETFVIKFLKFPEEDRKTNWKTEKRIKRFEREIEALHVAKQNDLEHVIKIYFSGKHKINNLHFHYYVMEKCDLTLKDYLIQNDLDKVQKTLLCYKILKGIINLHEYKIYHRDIKHDNIYFIGHNPIIADLGLVHYRDSDIRINERGDLIGPTGWFSPEAINKYLVEKSKNPYNLDCIIDDKSEVFQLGKLFWYIFQGNLPIGQIHNYDFLISDDSLFKIIIHMLQNAKSKRADTSYVDENLGKFLKFN